MTERRFAYKVFNIRKDGSLGPLFVDASSRIPMTRWVKCRKDLTPPGWISKSRRPGWHSKVTPDEAFRMASYDKRRGVFLVEVRGNVKINRRGLVLSDEIKVIGRIEKC